MFLHRCVSLTTEIAMHQTQDASGRMVVAVTSRGSPGVHLLQVDDTLQVIFNHYHSFSGAIGSAFVGDLVS